jgi:hypothetical protein
MEKAVLMSLVKKRTSNTVNIEELWLQDIVESYFFPCYRKVYTKVKTFSVIIFEGN